MIICHNCGFDNPAGTQKCQSCDQPLLMTQMISQAPAPNSQAIPVLTQIGSTSASPNVAVMTRLALVPYDSKNVLLNDPASMIFMPDRGVSMLLGWNYYPSDPTSKPSLVDIDLPERYPWITITGADSIDVAVSRRTAFLRTDNEGLSFMQVHQDMHTDVWANPYGTERILIPPNFEIPVVPGMHVFMGKHRIGVTFIVQEI